MRNSGIFIGNGQVALFSRHTHHRKRATLALAEGFELLKRLGRNRHHVALLAFVRPNFFGRQARFFERHSAQIKACATAGVVG